MQQTYAIQTKYKKISEQRKSAQFITALYDDNGKEIFNNTIISFPINFFLKEKFDQHVRSFEHILMLRYRTKSISVI